MIFVELAHSNPWPVGAQVTGLVIFDPAYAGSDRATAIAISLRWRTEGRGDQNNAIVQTLTAHFTDGPPRTTTRFPFRLALPPDGPVSYHGTLFRVIWEVQARVDLSWGIDPRAVEPFLVVPRLAAPDSLERTR